MAASPEHQAGVEDRGTTELFLAEFSEIERLLNERLSRHGRETAADLIQEYAGLNPYWARDRKDLDHFRQIRNFLTHGQSAEHGFPVVVAEWSYARLVEIREGLRKARVPVSGKHKKDVTSIRPDTSLAKVLHLAYEKMFSQFPVVDGGGRFGGLVTENEITRWLGRQVRMKRTNVDLAGVPVKAVLREKEPDSKQIPIFRFESLESPEAEVMGLFMLHPALEVVLLTSSGEPSSPIEGIVTQWDAARYPSPWPAGLPDRTPPTA
jgi:CBS domain-containing protein